MFFCDWSMNKNVFCGINFCGLGSLWKKCRIYFCDPNVLTKNFLPRLKRNHIYGNNHVFLTEKCTSSQKYLHHVVVYNVKYVIWWYSFKFPFVFIITFIVDESRCEEIDVVLMKSSRCEEIDVEAWREMALTLHQYLRSTFLLAT